jgi:hypothetical protein
MIANYCIWLNLGIAFMTVVVASLTVPIMGGFDDEGMAMSRKYTLS